MADASDGWKDGLGDLEALDKQALQLLDVVVRVIILIAELPTVQRRA